MTSDIRQGAERATADPDEMHALKTLLKSGRDIYGLRACTRAIEVIDQQKAELDRLQAEIRASATLFDAIQHGDAEHRAWLKAAIAAHFAGQPVPPTAGSGNKEKRIADLEAENRAMREVVAVFGDMANTFSDEQHDDETAMRGWDAVNQREIEITVGFIRKARSLSPSTTDERK